MAIVSTPENRVELRPTSRQPFQAAEFDAGEIIARGVERLGKSVMNFAEQEEEKDLRFAQTAAQRARTEAVRRVGEVRSRVTQAKLLDAERVRQEGVEEIETIKRDSMAALKDPLAQRMFADSFEAAVSSDRLRMREHADQQLRVAEDAEADSAIDLATERAVEMWDDPETVAAERGTIDANIQRRLRGSPPQVVELARKKVFSNIHTRTAIAILSSDDPGAGIEAMEYYREHAAEITSEDEAKLFNTIQPQYDNDLIEGVFGETIAAVASDAASEEPPPAATPAPREVKGSDYSPTRGVGRVSSEVAAHQRRGRTAKDFAAPEGTPIYPPTTGEVIEAPREKQGNNGYMIRIRHPNGLVTTYLHMRGPSPLKPGDQVGAGTIIGSVGNTGRSTGPHVDFSVKDAKGNAVNPDNVTWSSQDLPVYIAQRHDLEAWYRRAHEIAMKRGLNSRQYEALLARVDRHVGRQETLERREQDEIDRQILDQAVTLDEELKDIGQIPNFGRGSPSMRAQILNMIDQNTRATEPKAGGDAFYLLDGLAHGSEEEQAEFLRYNPRELPLTRGEQVYLQRIQQKIRGEIRESVSDSETAASLSRVETSMRRMLGDPRNAGPGGTGFEGEINTDEERRRWSMLRSAVSRRVEIEQRGKKDKLTDEQYDAIVRSELQNATVRMRSGGKVDVPFYQIPEQRERLGDKFERATIEVPLADQQRIRQELARRGIHNPSERQIVTYYRRGLMYQRR
jgi:soluble lytic murein transglycosylase